MSPEIKGGSVCGAACGVCSFCRPYPYGVTGVIGSF